MKTVAVGTEYWVPWWRAQNQQNLRSAALSSVCADVSIVVVMMDHHVDASVGLAGLGWG